MAPLYGFTIAQNKTFMIPKQIQILHVDRESNHVECCGVPVFFPARKAHQGLQFIKKGEMFPPRNLDIQQEILMVSVGS